MQHNLLHSSLALAITLLLSGCAAINNNYTQPELLQHRAELNSSGDIEFTRRTQRWWRAFDNPLLTGLIEQALHNNRSLQRAKANMQAAYAYFKDIDNDTAPSGDVGMEYSAADQVIPGITEQRVLSRSYRAGASLRWSLDLFGKLQSAADASLADAQAENFGYRAAQVNVAAQVATLFGQYQGLLLQSDVTQKTINSLTTTQQIVEARVNAGYGTDLDALRIAAQLRGAEAIIAQLNGQINRTRNALASLVGQTPAEFTRQLITYQQDAKVPMLHSPFAIGVPEDVLRYRFDVIQAERQLAASYARVDMNKASLYPDVSVSGFLGFLTGDISNFGSQTQAWNLAPSISWPLFDYSSITAKIEASEAVQRAALANFELATLKALEEAQSALDAYSNSEQQQQLLSQQVALSKQALQLAQVQYDAGSIELLDVLDVERTLLQARSQLTQAQTQVFNNVVEVYRSFGGGLELHENKAVQG